MEQGDNVDRMIDQLGLTDAELIDLSTGINPHAWSAPTPPPDVWQRLPDPHDGLVEAACAYYGTHALLPVPGIETALALLPFLRAPSRVAVTSPGYAEHGAAWSRAGHEVVPLSSAQLAGGAGTAFDVVVLVNPNDPDGTLFEPDTLREWCTGLASRGGWLIVDETYMDTMPASSLAGSTPLPGLLVLRSVGGFFGLAGMRAGFVLGDEGLLKAIEEVLGPRAVDGPARWVARQALTDHAWQARMRERLVGESRRLEQVLADHFGQRAVGTPLFRTVLTPAAGEIHEALARAGILVRLLDRQDGLRFGLPGDEAGWRRLQEGLESVVPRETTGP